MAKRIDSNTIDQILMNKVVMGLDAKTAALRAGVNANTVYSVLRVYNAIREDDWDAVVCCANKNISSLDAVSYIAGSQGKAVPLFVSEAFLERNKKVMQRKYEPAEDQLMIEEKENQILEKHFGLEPEDNSGLYLIKILEAVTEMNSLLREMCEAWQS